MPAQFPLAKFKVELKLASSRLQFLQAKHNSLATKARRDIALLLEANKHASAEIRVEGIIREDLHVEAMEIVELYCELLCTRAGLIDQAQNDAGLGEAIHSVIYASSRIEVKELPRIRDMLGAKYGKELVKKAMSNEDGLVNERLLKKLSLDPPSKALVRMYLKEIAAAYSVDWVHDDSDDGKPSGGLGVLADVSPPAEVDEVEAESEEIEESEGSKEPEDAKEPESDDAQLPSPPTTMASLPSVPTSKNANNPATSANNPTPVVVRAKKPLSPVKKPLKKTPSPAKPESKQSATDDGTPSMDDLQRRFNALKGL
ncbi:Vacuolar protein sorting-associated protein ist1 [Coemansia sp. RSA 2523]|nr:Vacuolar protein sorting-associated protein ist1 [Coemansia sp. RSA 1824]KAJ1792545.1 Vacuolar protein sorting-associated protein ist1 [Coemansia sp. RSA 2167]KAJ1807909.1 Vacuolar protein sorting-associated protein ist1 [Coemansia sp. RSA 2523]KAJ2154272.1 Vacuolar protein sorting-associated protein ist1 [Coemansia sp. RSA 637]KAJ2194942.1 Vacuolar protein sorting-associated protein ist1 [Coemansia sp. RSA 522]KAJ2196197.1 Vacuolar protein sorting-associated protein ist1 [Coemansia sp. RSA